MAIVDSKFELKYIERENIPYIWVALVPFIERILGESQGETSLNSYLEGLSNGKLQGWIIFDGLDIKAVTVTRIDTWDSYTALHILGLAGAQWPVWKDHHGELEHFARRLGCDCITMQGRKGWKRMFDRFKFEGTQGEKYEEVAVMMQMKLEYKDDR